MEYLILVVVAVAPPVAAALLVGFAAVEERLEGQPQDLAPGRAPGRREAEGRVAASELKLDQGHGGLAWGP